MPMSSDEPLPELSAIDTLDVFILDRLGGPLRITEANPVLGELVGDASGRWFLAPEPDYRGGDMGAVRLHNLTGEAKAKLRGQLVSVTGIYTNRHGIDVEAVERAG